MKSMRDHDSRIGTKKPDDCRFTVLNATYYSATHKRLETSDFRSYGLVDSNDTLAFVGELFSDNPNTSNSEILCTRWGGTEKDGDSDNIIDFKRLRGNPINLYKDAYNFIYLNTRIRFKKTDYDRMDMPDYSLVTVKEALINALAHRDYNIPDGKIYIDMYDNRLEIASPGGMPDGMPIQNRDIYSIEPMRRNPVICNLLSTLGMMKCKGEGLREILEHTLRQTNYSDGRKPAFISTDREFRVIMKNLNYDTQKS